jgi:hypothetical protein
MTEIKYTMNLDPEIHKQLKIVAIQRGLNVKDYLLSLFFRDIQHTKDVDNSFDKISNKYDKTLKNLNKR